MGPTSPKLRFSGFTDPWEQRKLGEVASFAKGVGFTKEDIAEVGTQLLLYGRLYTAYQCAIERVDTLAKPMEGAVYSKGTEVVTPSSGETAEDIAIASAVLSPGIMLGGGLNIIQPSVKLDQVFLALSISNGRQHFDLARRAQGKSVAHLYNADLSASVVAFPSKAEQRTIGTFFSSLDELITLHQRKYGRLVQVKAALLSKMFPKPGENEPEVRFAGYHDPWEQRKLGEICSFSKGRGYSKDDLRESGTPIILYGRLYTQYETRIKEVDTFATEGYGSMFSVGNEVIVPASGETAEDIAVASSVRSAGIILGGDLNIVRPDRRVDQDFLALGITYGRTHRELSKRAQGKSVVHLHGTDIAEVDFAFPSREEQSAIASAILAFDDLIALHQRKVQMLKALKRAFLDKMFV